MSAIDESGAGSSLHVVHLVADVHAGRRRLLTQSVAEFVVADRAEERHTSRLVQNPLKRR